MNDPVKGCDVYKNIGCAHVDGFLCDYPNCSILKDYRMNERIKELAGQAREYVEDAIELGFPKDQVDDIRDEKFAESIIQECINEIAYIGKANEVFGDRTDRGGLNHILWTTETSIKKIKQRFGLEE